MVRGQLSISEINLKVLQLQLVFIEMVSRFVYMNFERHQVEGNGETERIPANNQAVELPNDGFRGDRRGFSSFRP